MSYLDKSAGALALDMLKRIMERTDDSAVIADICGLESEFIALIAERDAAVQHAERLAAALDTIVADHLATRDEDDETWASLHIARAALAAYRER